MIRVTENAINEITPAKEITPSKLYNEQSKADAENAYNDSVNKLLPIEPLKTDSVA